MRWLLGLLCSVAFSAQVSAQIINTLPYQLQNGTTADASQVMADFNQIVNNTNSNAAKNGANSDITSITGLTTPLTVAQGGTSVYAGGTSTGTANAQVLASPSPSGFTLTANRRVTFTAGASNTGPMTLNVNGTGAISVTQLLSSGLAALVGGEAQSGTTVDVVYNGTSYQLMSQASTVPVGFIGDYGGLTAPTGWLFTYGQAVSRSTYGTLFGVITTTLTGITTNGSAIVTGISSTTNLQAGFPTCGTGIASGSAILTVDSGTQVTLSLNATGSASVSIVFAPYGCGDNSTTFNLPDYRGRVAAAPDAMGGSAASRLTSTYFGVGAVLGAVGGSQTTTLIQNQLPASIGSVTSSIDGQTVPIGASSNTLINTGPNPPVTVGGSAGAYPVFALGAVTNAGGGNPHRTIQPTLIANKIIKY